MSCCCPAASDSESGADLSTQRDLEIFPTLDGKFHGAFTDAVLRLMSGQLSLPGGAPLVPGSFTYSQGREAVEAFLKGRHLAQQPQLLLAIAEDKDNVGARIFSYKACLWLSPVALNLPHEQSLAAPAGSPSSTPPAVPETAATPVTAGRRMTRVRVESVPAGLKAGIARLSGVSLVEGEAASDLIVRQNGAPDRMWPDLRAIPSSPLLPRIPASSNGSARRRGSMEPFRGARTAGPASVGNRPRKPRQYLRRV